MPSPAFRCARCKRTFKLAAHLARHNNAIHGAGSRSKSSTTAKPKKAGRRPGRPKGSGKRKATRVTARVVAAGSMSDGAARLLTEMQSYHSNLAVQRMSLDAEIDAVASAMQLLGRSVPAGRPRKKGRPVGSVKKRRGRPVGSVSPKRGRPVGSTGRRGSLKDFIVRVLSQHTKPLSPQDIGTRVVKAGFKTKAKDLTKAISNLLPSVNNVKRVGFGQYQLGGL